MEAFERDDRRRARKRDQRDATKKIGGEGGAAELVYLATCMSATHGV